jgi:signal transduction histidine kinase
MTQVLQSRIYRGSYLIGFILIGVVALRGLLAFLGQPSFALAVLILVLYALLYSVEPFVSARWRGYRFLYFPLQTILVVVLNNLRPYLDISNLLYIPLSVQTIHVFTRRQAIGWMGLYAVLIIATQVLAIGWIDGLARSLMVLGGSAFLISYDFLYNQTQADQAKSQLMLAELQQAHKKLQEYAEQAEELGAARERNRLARELHDTVSQLIFSITLTARSAKLLLERDPARLPEQIDRLQEMTSSALAQLRSLIAELRPPAK